MEAYSRDLRERVVRAVDENRGTRRQIAATFGVSTSWVRKLLRRRRETGSIDAKPRGGGRQPRLDDQGDRQLRELVEQRPDATLSELCQQMDEDIGTTCVHRALRRLGLSLKRRSCTPRNATGRTCGGGVRIGGRRSRRSTRRGWSSSMKRVPGRT